MRVNLLQGRFQPFTLGHMKCVEEAAKEGIPTVIAQIETKTADKKHPFTSKDLEPVMDNLVNETKDILDYMDVKNADIVKIGELFASKGYEIVSWTCGTDRIKDYEKMAKKYHDQAGLADDFHMIEVKRTDEDISATKVREAIKVGDKTTFDRLTPKCIHKFYDMFKMKLNEVLIESLKIENNVMVNNVEELFGTLQQSIVAEWRKHLKTSKYSKHMALDEFYKEMPELVDTLIEDYMGHNKSKIENYKNVLNAEDMDALEYLEALHNICDEGTKLLGDVPELLSDMDAIRSKIDAVMYKLRELDESNSNKSLSEFVRENLNIKK